MIRRRYPEFYFCAWLIFSRACLSTIDSLITTYKSFIAASLIYWRWLYTITIVTLPTKDSHYRSFSKSERSDSSVVEIACPGLVIFTNGRTWQCYCMLFTLTVAKILGCNDVWCRPSGLRLNIRVTEMFNQMCFASSVIDFQRYHKRHRFVKLYLCDTSRYATHLTCRTLVTMRWRLDSCELVRASGFTRHVVFTEMSRSNRCRLMLG